MDRTEKTKLLDELREKMKNDKTLPLRRGASNLVFGEGNPDCQIMCIGEGPGYWEDQKGRPFVGNAGAFLNQLLVDAGYKREDVFITNVVHFRPPENRDPLPEEIAAFAEYLDQMIEIINPQVIVTLGRFSMGKFLPAARITGVHGKKYNVKWNDKSLIVVPMYHPAAGLRNPAVKEQTITDFKKLPDILKESKDKAETLKESTTESSKKPEQMNLI